MDKYRPLRELDNGGLLSLVRDFIESVRMDSDPGSPCEREATETLEILSMYESRASVRAIRNEVA